MIISTTIGLYAFDRSLNGSWGITKDGEKIELIRFNNTEIIVMNTLFRSNDYEEADNTIYLELDGESILIQYHLLSSNKLLFIMTDADNFSEALTLILTKL
jgi:sensor domain CHASE-containing protein